jgi:hypothetical protein
MTNDGSFGSWALPQPLDDREGPVRTEMVEQPEQPLDHEGLRRGPVSRTTPARW